MTADTSVRAATRALALPYGAPELPRPHPHIHPPATVRELLAGRPFTWESPSDLGPCEQCDVVGRCAVATITWADRTQASGEDMIRACRTCLPTAVEIATNYAGDALDIGVTPAAVRITVPAWRPVDLPKVMSGVTPRQAWSWVAAHYLHTEDDPTPGSGYERGWLLADEVVACAVIAALRVLGVEPAGARLLWDHNPGLVAGILADARNGGNTHRPPVGPDGEVYGEEPMPERHRAPRSTCPLCGGQGHPSPGSICRCQA